MDNPVKLATYGTQDEEKQNKNNPEKLATQGTQDEEKQNKNNPEKLATQGTQDKGKQNKTQKQKQKNKNSTIYVTMRTYFFPDAQVHCLCHLKTNILKSLL